MAKDMLDNKSYENKYIEYTDVYIKRRMERYKFVVLFIGYLLKNITIWQRVIGPIMVF